MFGSRLLMNMACKSVIKSSFKITKSFSSMAPIYNETTSLLNRVNCVPSNLLIRNLRQIILKAEQDLQVDVDIICPNQISLMLQVNQTVRTLSTQQKDPTIRLKNLQ